MRWCFLVVFIVFWIDVNGQCISDNQDLRFGRYKKCMANYGIPKWKIVDLVSNSTYYGVFKFQFNKMFKTVFPIAIFIPSSVYDVQVTVKCGFKAKIQLVPNSGSHSYAGLSLGTNDSIIIDFRYMNFIDINEKEESVTVGPGAFVGHVNAKLWQNGGFGTVLGNCMTVAMGGHAIGGGIGYYSGLYGLVIDNLLEIKMVDARGNAVTVNPIRNPDLWWAMRGVGPGYIGLVTSFKLKMFKAMDLNLTFVQIRYKVKDFQNVMASYFKWLDWVKQNEPSVFSVVNIVNDNYTLTNQQLWPGIEVQLLHILDPKIQPNCSTAFLKAFPSIFPKATEILINYPSYIEFVIATSYTPVVHKCNAENMLNFFSTLTKDMAIPRYTFYYSFFVKKQFRAKDFKAVQEVVSEIPNNTNGIQITSEQGAIGTRRAKESAYVHRDSLCDIRIFFDSLNIEDVALGKMWAKKFLKSTRFMDAGETYQNFPEPGLKNYLTRYYGSNLGNLIRVKRKWDPNGYFNSKMSIPVY